MSYYHDVNTPLVTLLGHPCMPQSPCLIKLTSGLEVFFLDSSHFSWFESSVQTLLPHVVTLLYNYFTS